MSTEKKPKSGSTPSGSKAPKKGASKSSKVRRRKRGGSRQRGSGNSKNDSKDVESIQRANSRFDRKPKPMGLNVKIEPPPKSVNLNWKLNPVPNKIEREVGEIVINPGEFGFLDDERVDEIADQIGNRPITLEQALSLRAALNQEKAVFSHGRLQRRAREMLRRYDGGESVLSLSKRFDFPPVNLFRAILTARNWSKNRIKEALREPEKKLKKRDIEEFRKQRQKIGLRMSIKPKPITLQIYSRKFSVTISERIISDLEHKQIY